MNIIFGFALPVHRRLLPKQILKTKGVNAGPFGFYSYAHVPWLKGNGQRGYKDSDLPKAEVKRSS